MEGGRSPIPSVGLGAPLVSAPTPSRRPQNGMPTEPSPPLALTATDSRHSEAYYEVKGTIFGALIEAIDLLQLAKLDAESSREEIRDIVNEIIAIKNIVMSISEQEELLDDICNDVLGYGPLEPLLARDDISDIMVNGSGTRARSSAPAFASATISSCSISASASSARSAAASMNPRRSATPACPTAPASTSSCRRSRSTALRSPSANSRRTSSRSSSWSNSAPSRRRAPIS
jgi:hypothetical protein